MKYTFKTTIVGNNLGTYTGVKKPLDLALSIMGPKGPKQEPTYF